MQTLPFFISTVNSSLLKLNNARLTISFKAFVIESCLRMMLSNVHGSVKKVIELTKLMGYFPIAGTVDDAIQKITTP